MAKSKPEPRHFFKVFFPVQSSTILRIPPAFREKIEAESGKRVSLKGPSGGTWKVNLVKDCNEFFFDDGWGEFVADHSLVMGDFLIFRYRGNSKFKVLVFDSTACEKKEALLARPSGEQSEESREEVSVVEEDDEDEENKPLVLLAKKIFEKNSSRKRGINEIFKKKKQLQVGHLRSNSRDLIVTDENAGPSRSIFRLGSLISQRRPVTEEEVKMALERAATFKSNRPFAIAVMQDSYVYTSFFMCIPTWFAREHLPKENTKMAVWDPTGKRWSITYICYSSHGALSGGWARFSFANNLEKYDVCIFELIKMDELQVHIYRVVEEITPLVRRRVCHNKFLDH